MEINSKDSGVGATYQFGTRYESKGAVVSCLLSHSERSANRNKQVDADGNATWDTTQRFVYDGEDVVLVYAGSSASSLTNRYLVGPNTDEILADENAAGVVTWSLADNLGTVRDLVQYNTATNTTTVVNHIKYDTFGQIKSQSNSAWQPLFAYTGREWDGDAGM